MVAGAKSFSSIQPSVPAAERLAALGLDVEVLSDSLMSGVQGARNVSPHHPVTARGYVLWADSVGALRSSLTARGWTNDDRLNVPRVVSPDGEHALVIMGGNDSTGRSLDFAPGLARRRGPATHRAVEVNGQLELFKWGATPATEDIRTWVLLYRWSRAEPVIRAELSLPSRMDKGDVVAWKERILLPEISLDQFDLSDFDVTAEDDVYFGISQTS